VRTTHAPARTIKHSYRHRAAALAAESRARRLRRLEDWIGEEY
jgi:hypothetical protein